MRVVKYRDAPGVYAIESYFSQALTEHARAVPGVRFDYPSKVWWGYADAIAAVVARLASVGVTVDAEALPAPDVWREARTGLMFATKGLRDYQIEGVRFLLAKGAEGALLADGMRLGKSLQALTAARAWKQKTLIVAPSFVVGVWARPPTDAAPGEIAKWWPDAFTPSAGTGTHGGVYVLEGVRPPRGASSAPLLPEELQRALVVVTSYDVLYAWVEHLQAWNPRTLILDEVHALQSHKSRRSAAVAALASLAKRRIFLSGTPMTSRPRDLHNVLETLAPGRFGYFITFPKDGKPPGGSFARHYCAAHQKTVGRGPEAKTVWDFSGASNLSADAVTAPAIVGEETLHERLRYLMLRRVKSEVDIESVGKTREIIDVKVTASKALTLTSRLLNPAGLRRALDLAADGKLKSVVALAAEHAQSSEQSVIVFCYRRLFAEVVCKALQAKRVAADYVHGGMTQRQRDAVLSTARQAATKGPVVVCATIDTTSVGIDLSFADAAVFAELTWEPHELAQAEERIYVYGQATSPLVQYVIARGTGDELILRGVINKLDNFEAGIGPTGDRLREDLKGNAEKRQETAMARLALTLAEMQKPAHASVSASRRSAGALAGEASPRTIRGS